MNVRRIRQHIDNRLNQAINFTQSERVTEKIRDGEFNSRLRRMTLQAILATPGLPDFLYERHIVRPYARIGREVIGAGAHSIALADGTDKVQKVLFETRGKSETEQRAFITELDADQEVSLRHLEPFTLAQSFAIEPDPLHPHQPIVIARQQRVDGISATPIFHGELDGNSKTDEFIAGSHTMLHAERALPDLDGNANVIINDDGLHMIDSLCVREQTTAFNATLTMLEPHFNRIARDRNNSI